jgi:hypothetical protein
LPVIHKTGKSKKPAKKRWRVRAKVRGAGTVSCTSASTGPQICNGFGLNGYLWFNRPFCSSSKPGPLFERPLFVSYRKSEFQR